MSFAGITDLWAYVAGCVAIILLPGPNSLYVMSTAALDGRAAARAAVAGVLVADTVFIVGSALGLVALLQALPWLFDGLRWAGGAYLAWLGLRLLGSAAGAKREAASAPSPSAATAIGRGQPQPPAQAFRKAVAIGLLNPKAMMFYVAFFPQFVDPRSSDGFTFLAMGTILQACSLVYLAALVLGGGRLADAARRSRWLAVLGKSATGALFIGFGAKIALARPVQ
ncbi:MAG TPA: leucine efflux protein LeuE [Quisquiliibacterium sp.]|nr:leucine efflux protein LeuE [Quisquiliibacterium sp.]